MKHQRHVYLSGFDDAVAGVRVDPDHVTAPYRRGLVAGEWAVRKGYVVEQPVRETDPAEVRR